MMPLRIGHIGCGRISDIYLENCARFDEIELLACASLDIAESQAKADQHGIPKACSVEGILDDLNIDAVLNLTIPTVHAEIGLRVLAAGKHVYAERPFATELADGKKLLSLARKNGLTINNAPDTFLGGRWQTVRKMLDQCVIGQPTGVAAAMSGAFIVGANRHSVERGWFAGGSWIYAPGGPLISETSDDCSVVTTEVNLIDAQNAQSEYPMTMFETYASEIEA